MSTSRTVPFPMSSSSSKLAYNLDPSKGGVKADTNKLCWHLLPYAAVAEVVAVLQVGAEKYSQWNWLGGMPYSRCHNSAMRHLTAWWAREDNDPESGLSHLAHAACNLLFLLTFVLMGRGEDDRPEVAAPRTVHKSGVPV